MSKKDIFYMSAFGRRVPVSEEVAKADKIYERKERYFTEDLKQGSFTSDPEKQTAEFIPAREDSYERPLEAGEQFPACEILPEDSVIENEMILCLHEALHSLSKEELCLIYKLFYLDQTERQVAADLDIPSSTVHDRKRAVLRKLKKFF